MTWRNSCCSKRASSPCFREGHRCRFRSPGRAPEVTRPWWREALEQAGVSDAPPSLATLVHNDLAAEHVLVGETTAMITGIIDWSDAKTSDPAVDFGGLYHWGGEPFLKAVLSFYDRPIDEGLARRARFLGLCRGVGDVLFGVETNREEYVAAGLRALERGVQRYR
jgi:aminoglycoside phosphotransferase (APT) family kinase protein